MQASSSTLGAGLAALAVLGLSCSSPSAPPAGPEPDVRGSWGGTGISWRWNENSPSYPDLTRTAACQGRLEITDQAGASFSGRYAIDCVSAGPSSGLVHDGRIGADGRLSFRLQAVQGWPPGAVPGMYNPTCRLVTDPEPYEGTLAGGLMRASRAQLVECASGQYALTAAFQGSRN